LPGLLATEDLYLNLSVQISEEKMAARINAENSNLLPINIDLIEKNKDNPRTFFREQELDELRESIKEFGVQVPISVYKDGKKYVLIDGERRWKCCLKLDRKTIPALVQEKPSELDNLLLMFNIHSLREQWDYFTIASKLPKVILLLLNELGTEPTERQISKKTGLTLGQIRRCKLLIDLPEKYKEELNEELKKPKALQQLSEDFFIEMERSLKTVHKTMPEIISNPDKVRNVLIDKYRKEILENIVDFRLVSKIARAENVESDQGKARKTLQKLFEKNSYTIKQAFSDSVEGAYFERDLVARVEWLTQKLDLVEHEEIEVELREKLKILEKRISKFLRGE
jgi:ParB family chromosome partitioning protein